MFDVRFEHDVVVKLILLQPFGERSAKHGYLCLDLSIGECGHRLPSCLATGLEYSIAATTGQASSTLVW